MNYAFMNLSMISIPASGWISSNNKMTNHSKQPRCPGVYSKHTGLDFSWMYVLYRLLFALYFCTYPEDGEKKGRFRWFLGALQVRSWDFIWPFEGHVPYENK